MSVTAQEYQSLAVAGRRRFIDQFLCRTYGRCRAVCAAAVHCRLLALKKRASPRSQRRIPGSCLRVAARFDGNPTSKRELLIKKQKLSPKKNLVTE